MSAPPKVAAGKSRSSCLKLPDAYSIRAGGIADVDAVYRLNLHAFDSSWSRQAFYSALDSGYDLLLCECDGELAGYLLSMTLFDETQVMQIAVAEAHRRQGLAAAMTRSLTEKTPSGTNIMLEVRISNAAARGLYAKLGFVENGYRKNYYAPDADGFCEDAVLMQLHIP